MNYDKKPHEELHNEKQKHMPGKMVVLLSFSYFHVHEIRESARKTAGRTIATSAHFNEAVDGVCVGIKKIGIAKHYSYQY
jgi:hypothetical protein